MKLTLLGTGSPEPYARRASSGYVLEAGGQRVMVDCGGGSVSRLIEAGWSPADIDLLLISHLHSDHMIDFARLVHARWDARPDPLPVYAPAPIAAISERSFGTGGTLAHDLIARTEFPASQEIWTERGGTLPRPWPAPAITEIVPGWCASFGDLRVTSVEVPHAQPFLTCLGFRFDLDGQAIVYSGDSGPCAALTELAKGADILVHMCFHLSDETRGTDWTRGASGHMEVAHTAQDAGVGHVILTHLRPHMDTPGTHARILRDMRTVFDGQITIGEDLMSFDLPRP